MASLIASKGRICRADAALAIIVGLMDKASAPGAGDPRFKPWAVLFETRPARLGEHMAKGDEQESTGLRPQGFELASCCLFVTTRHSWRYFGGCPRSPP